MKCTFINSTHQSTWNLTDVCYFVTKHKIIQIQCAERFIPLQHVGLSMPQLARTGPGGPPLELLSVPRRAMERSFINSVINRPGISLFYVILPEKSIFVIFGGPNAPFRSNMLASQCFSSRARVREDPLSSP